MTTTVSTPIAVPAKPRHRRRSSPYPTWFLLPAAIVYGILFLIPTFASLYFSLTRWTLFNSSFIGLDNFVAFFEEPFLIQGVVNTIIFALLTCALKVVFGLGLAVLLTSQIHARGLLRSVVFFPVLVSTVGVGIAFTAMMHPTDGIINAGLGLLGIKGPGWLTNPSLAIYSVAFVEVWRGVGLATVIFIAGIVSIPQDYYEAARIDGATGWERFVYITLPLSRPAMVTVVILSFIHGLRNFELVWAMTRGGPGFASDVLASVIYKQYQAGFYGLSTAGNVVLFVLIAAMAVPLYLYLNRKEGHQ
ncbi:carbohydrate ABC transporter permease [Pelagibacterium xiamenense]|uniref:carbohydrate ABC transporter permease n=1 Tax=Pelagibacterium xiamenense TaxID=2901140 RepID=UPI001E2D680E|nr:sugar ABC transporter permease [Pelagibacterium xiamenense]MCD7061127.1 sugar ABC transporter permease [Pelagibacterium xiamenense]